MHYLKNQRPGLMADLNLPSRILLPPSRPVKSTHASQLDRSAANKLGADVPKSSHFAAFVILP